MGAGPQTRPHRARDLKTADGHRWTRAPLLPSAAAHALFSPSAAPGEPGGGRAPAAESTAVNLERPIDTEQGTLAGIPGNVPGGEPRAVSQRGAPDRSTVVEVGFMPGRPGFTESRGIVAPATIEVEGGYAFTADRTGGLASHTSYVPGLVVHLGFDARTEFRIAAAGFTRQTLRSSAGIFQSSGFGDVQAGMKLLALREDEAGWEIGVIPMVSIPSRVSDVSSFGYDPSLTISFARTLQGRCDISGMVSWARPTVEGARQAQYSGSVSVAREIWGKWGGSVEVFAISDPATGLAQWNLGAALAREIGPHLEADLYVGHSLSHLAPEWSLDAGFVVR
jgi:hypothetical protein